MKLNDSFEFTLTPDQAVVALLSARIEGHLRAASSGQHYPAPDADRVDDTIKSNLERAAKLRSLRAEFETLTTGVIL